MDKKEMVEAKSWKYMHRDVLLKIFATLSLMDLVLNVSSVCKSWRSVCYDESLWKTLDLTELNKLFHIPAVPVVWSDDQSSRRFWRILKHFLNLSNGNFSTVVFHLSIEITDKHLAYTARRSPRLRMLVLPLWSRITSEGFTRAFRVWKELDSLVIPGCRHSLHTMMQLIGKNLKNLSNLKLAAQLLDMKFAASIVKYLPRLKTLSLKASLIQRDAIEHILDNLENLQEMNLSHCYIDAAGGYPQYLLLGEPVYQRIIQKASRLRRFYVCRTNNCVMCRCEYYPPNMALLRWQELWRTDEISSLAY